MKTKEFINKNKDEQKFYVRLMPREFNWGTYLNQNRITASIFIDDYENNDYKQTIFTESEYNRIRKNCPDWLPEFDKDDKHFEFLENK